MVGVIQIACRVPSVRRLGNGYDEETKQKASSADITLYLLSPAIAQHNSAHSIVRPCTHKHNAPRKLDVVLSRARLRSKQPERKEQVHRDNLPLHQRAILRHNQHRRCN
jgi:hypothetical protein